MFKYIKKLSYLFLFVAGIVLVVVLYLFFATKAKESGMVKVQGINMPVTIERDQFGIPHITAESDEDGFFALGYVHAQDRMWQMEMQRHIAQGTLSEMLGDAAIEQDKFLRTIGFYLAAKQTWQALPDETKKKIHNYTNGVNSFLKTGKLSLPFIFVQYKPAEWTDIDSIAFHKMMAWDLQSTWKEKIENAVIAAKLGESQVSVLLPPYPHTAPTILSDESLKLSSLLVKTTDSALKSQVINDEKIDSLVDLIKHSDNIKSSLSMQDAPGKGSNNWVVSGRLTQTKKPLLASDPHLSLSAPILWYMADLKTPNFHSRGATIPGLPLIVIGHNDYIAWGMTNACIDAQDLYIESNNTPLTPREEIIKVKNGKDVHYIVNTSKHGPIISDISSAGTLGKKVALKWPAIMPGDTTVQSFLELNYVRNWQEFTKALESYVTPSQNFIYADIKGNIGYYLTGKIPVRDGWNGQFPVNSEKNLEWKGYIPFFKMPHVLNPKEGYIASANNQVVSGAYPYSLTFRCGIPPYRIDRIDAMIKQHSFLTKHDMEVMQNDTKSGLWFDLRENLLKTKPLDKASADALTQLTHWNGNMNRDSKAAIIFAFWFKHLGDLTPKQVKSFSEWPEPLFIKQQLETNGTYCQINQYKSCQDFLSHSLKNAMHDLQSKQLVWGSVHHAYFEEMALGSLKFIGWIWNRSIPSAGDAFSINVGTYDFNNMAQIAGAGYRQIIDLNNLDNSEYIIALGQSENVFSKNYANLMTWWRDGKYVSMNANKHHIKQNKILNLVPQR